MRIGYFWEHDSSEKSGVTTMAYEAPMTSALMLFVQDWFGAVRTA